MNINLVKDVILLVEEFDSGNDENKYAADIKGFINWISDRNRNSINSITPEPIWEGKGEGRSPEGVISTLLVHLNRYAKTYSKSAIADSEFHTQDEFSYLITLKAFGTLTKMELIKKNVQDKSSGILIINRLIKQGWIQQNNSQTDKRSKVLKITPSGRIALENQMEKIRNASQIVSGNLNHTEKMELIRILSKLDKFHQPIFAKNIDNQKLLETVNQEYSFGKN